MSTSSLETAQKRLALQQEKLEIDKQLVRAEKKHLKQLRACQEQEMIKASTKIKELESQLFRVEESKHQAILEMKQKMAKLEQDKDDEIYELREKVMQMEHAVYAKVKGFESKLSAQQEEKDRCIRELQEESTKREKEKDEVISKLQEKALQMEETIEDLQHQIQQDHDTHESVVGELETKISQQELEMERLQQELNRDGEGLQMAISPSKASANKTEIQQYKNKLQSLRLAMEVAIRRTETEWKEKVDELEVQLATQQGEFEDKMETKTHEHETEISQLEQQLEYCEKSFQEERMQLQATIEQLKNSGDCGNEDPPGGESIVASRNDEELSKTRDELRALQKSRAEILKNQQAVQGRHSATTEDATKSAASRNALLRKKSSRVLEKKLHAVQDMEWSGSNQKGKYTGYVSENQEPHGRGTLKVENGDVYEGEWRNGRRHGQGVYTWATGDLYTGPWNRNRRHGHGVFVWSDGRLYDGEYNMGKREGTSLNMYCSFVADSLHVYRRLAYHCGCFFFCMLDNACRAASLSFLS